MLFNALRFGLLFFIQVLRSSELKDCSDEDLAAGLAKALKEQDASAERTYAAVLYARYFKQAYKMCRYYGLSHNDAEDTAQDAFMKLCRVGSGYREGSPFKPWFFKMVLNKTRDKFSELKRHRSEDPEFFTAVPENSENFHQKFQNQAVVDSILSRLPDKLRDTVSLRIVGNMDFNEIAASLHISSRQARNRLEQAYDLIRQMGVTHELG